MLNTIIVVVKETDYPLFKTIVEKNSNIVEIVKEYKLSEDYRDIQLCVGYSTQEPKNYMTFVLTTFPIIAARQARSRFICVPLPLTFKDFLADVYGVRENRCYFFYDMLSIEERYCATMALANFGNPYKEIKLLYYTNNSYYSLNFDRNCEYLFSSETELKLEDTTTGVIREIDLIDGLQYFKFNMAFLKPKSCK